MPKEMTEDEVRKKFLRYCWSMVEYWDKESRRETTSEKLQGLMHSILSTLDGCATALPGFILAPAPHPDDKEYCEQSGEDWYPQNNENQVKCDIAGCLHELFYNEKP